MSTCVYLSRRLIAVYETKTRKKTNLSYDQFSHVQSYKGKKGYAPELLLSMDNPGNKISFVTIEPDVYNSLLTKHSYPTLALHVSAILIDVEKMVVRKEEYIDTFYKEHKGVPSLI